MANNSIQNPHAQREGDLADLIAQETLLDLYGGEEKTYNGTALLVICTGLLGLAGAAVGIIYLIFGG